MRVLVIGASGFIGRHLVGRLNRGVGPVTATFCSEGPADGLNDWRRVEVTDPGGLSAVFRGVSPEVVVHLAAMADVGTAERQKERATAVNAVATASIARLCDAHDSRLIFVSTEYVFDGQRGYYREHEPPRPTTHYGRTKAEAEQAVSQMAAPWSIVRTSIVYGWPAPGRRNFVPWLVARLRRGERYTAASDTYRSPVFVGHLADGIGRLVDQEHTGIHHIAGRDWVTMYEFAGAVADGFGLEKGLVAAGSSDSPDRLGLDCAETIAGLGIDHHGLAEGIAAMRASPGALCF